jgi:hypothetical protein
MKSIASIALAFLLLCAAQAFAQKVWTNEDLKKPLPRPSRHLSEQEIASLRAGAYVAPPVYAPGGSYSIPWTPADDRPAHQLPALFDVNRFDGYYATQPLWQPLSWYPYSYPYYQRPIVVERRPARPKGKQR